MFLIVLQETENSISTVVMSVYIGNFRTLRLYLITLRNTILCVVISRAVCQRVQTKTFFEDMVEKNKFLLK